MSLSPFENIKGYADLGDLPENKRIQVVAQFVAERGQTVALALENDAKKIERYIRKLHDARPGLLEIEKLPGLIADTVTLKIKPKTQNAPCN